MAVYPRLVKLASALVCVALLLLIAPINLVAAKERGGNSSPAQTTAPTIAGAPLSISVLNNLSMAVNFNGDEQFFGDTAGGTFVQVDSTVYGSDPPASGAFTPLPFTAVSNSAVTGAGTEADPFKIVTVVRAGNTGVVVTQTTSYVNGDNQYRVEVGVANTGTTARTVRIFHGADLYLNFPGNAADFGFGIFDEESGAVGALSEDQQSVQVFIPITPADAFHEDVYDDFWLRIGTSAGQPGPGFNNTINPSFHDVAAGLQYNRNLAAGANATVSLFGAFGLARDVGITPEEEGRSARQADVSVALRPSPSTVVTRDSIVSVVVAVANHGRGRANSATVTLPFDPTELAVLDASFSRTGAWVRTAASNSLTIEMGSLGGNGSGTTDIVTGTLRFRVLPSAAEGAALFERAVVNWGDNVRGGQRASNLPIIVVGATNSTPTYYSLRVNPASERAGANFNFEGTMFAPDEPIGVWFNNPDGTVDEEPTFRADDDGGLVIDFDSTDLPPGTYSLVYYGHWTEFTAVATFVIR